VTKEYKGPVRIKDIANKAGVSTGTVDRVIHKRGRVSSENERKVREAIRVLEYEPNIIARSLAMKGDFKIAIIIPSYSKDSFWQSQFNGIKKAQKYIKDFGFSIEVLQFNDQKHGDLLKHKTVILEKKFDALLIAPTITDNAHELLDLCNQQNTPYLLVNTKLERKDNNYLGYVGQDSYQSGKLAAQLLSLMTSETRTLGVLHMEKEVENSEHMMQKQYGFNAFLDAQESSKIATVVDRIPWTSSKSVMKNAVKSFLASYPDLKGIFVTTSRIHYLVAALNSLRRDDLVIVGFDLIQENISALEKYEKIVLINQNPERQAYSGLMSLFEYLLNKKEVIKKQYLPLDIVTRENISTYIESIHY